MLGFHINVTNPSCLSNALKFVAIICIFRMLSDACYSNNTNVTLTSFHVNQDYLTEDPVVVGAGPLPTCNSDSDCPSDCPSGLTRCCNEKACGCKSPDGGCHTVFFSTSANAENVAVSSKLSGLSTSPIGDCARAETTTWAFTPTTKRENIPVSSIQIEGSQMRITVLYNSGQGALLISQAYVAFEEDKLLRNFFAQMKAEELYKVLDHNVVEKLIGIHMNKHLPGTNATEAKAAVSSFQ